MQTQPRLVAISGPLQGQRFDLGEQGISIGRVGEAVLAIDHVPVSRRHCLFVKQEFAEGMKNYDNFFAIHELLETLLDRPVGLVTDGSLSERKARIILPTVRYASSSGPRV